MQNKNESERRAESVRHADFLLRPYDVAVVGNDPAGYLCGFSAAKAGLKVIHLESNLLGVICPEWSPLALSEQMTSAVKGLLSSSIFIQPTRLLHFCRGIEDVKQFRLPGKVYDRKAFDREIAILAKNAGVHLVSGTYFRRLTERGLEVDYGGESYAIAARCVVGADGVRSPIRASLDYDLDDYLAVLQYRVQLRKSEETVRFFCAQNGDRGLGWFVPRGKMANVGFGVLKQVAHVLMFRLHHLLDQLIAEDLIAGDEMSEKSGGLIPMGDPLMPPGRDGVLLVGDAAGLRDPIIPGLGVGLATSCVAGLMAGEYLAEEILAKRTPRIAGYTENLKTILDGRIQLQSSGTAKKIQTLFEVTRN